MNEARRMTMNRQAFASAAVVVSAVTGIAALLAPAQLAGVFGATLDDVGSALTRLLAGTQTWFLVALEVVFTAGSGYFAFVDRSEVAAT
jgi:hypothetical protein